MEPKYPKNNEPSGEDASLQKKQMSRNVWIGIIIVIVIVIILITVAAIVLVTQLLKKDNNACPTGTHNCSTNARCTNIDGNVTCACNSGYTGDGINCVVRDSTPSDVFCPDDRTIVAPTGQTSAQVYEAAATDDRSDTVNLLYDPPSGSTFNVGTSTVVTVTGTDEAGNTAGCTFTITVTEDTTLPDVNCPPNIYKFVQLGQTTIANVTYPNPATATDNSGVSPNITYNPQSGSPFNVGVYPVNVTATDMNGNIDGCQFIVFVTPDITPPDVTCPPGMEEFVQAGQTSTIVTYPNAAATDNSGKIPTLEYTVPSGSLFNLGLNFVSVIATDFAGNIGSCSFLVTVRQ